MEMQVTECRTGTDVLRNRMEVRRRLWSARAIQDSGIDLRREKPGGRKGSDPIVAPPPRKVTPNEWRKTRPVTIHAPELWFALEPRRSPLLAIPTFKRYPPVKLIIQIVRNYFHLSDAEIQGQHRGCSVVRPRQIAMCLCKRLTPKSYPEIGRQFEDRDHTTVLHAVRKIESLCSIDDGMASVVSELESKIMAAFGGNEHVGLE